MEVIVSFTPRRMHTELVIDPQIKLQHDSYVKLAALEQNWMTIIMIHF